MDFPQQPQLVLPTCLFWLWRFIYHASQLEQFRSQTFSGRSFGSCREDSHPEEFYRVKKLVSTLGWLLDSSSRGIAAVRDGQRATFARLGGCRRLFLSSRRLLFLHHVPYVLELGAANFSTCLSPSALHITLVRGHLYSPSAGSEYAQQSGGEGHAQDTCNKSELILDLGT